jgi:upstream activation factor subunit UAF30
MAKKAKKASKKAAPKKASKKAAAPKKASKKVAKATSKKTSAKKASKKAAPKASKKAAAPKKAKTKRKPNPAFMRPLTPSSELAEVIGSKPIPRTEVVKKLWAYIRKNNLQDAKNRRNINADSKLKGVFGKNQVSMFEMTKLVSKHLS